MEKGRNRLPVTADAYGLTNPGTRRSLASRPPHRTGFEVTPIGENGFGRSDRRAQGTRPTLRSIRLSIRPKRASLVEGTRLSKHMIQGLVPFPGLKVRLPGETHEDTGRKP